MAFCWRADSGPLVDVYWRSVFASNVIMPVTTQLTDLKVKGGIVSGPPGKSQVAICFLKYTGTEPPRGRFVRPSVEYVILMTEKK